MGIVAAPPQPMMKVLLLCLGVASAFVPPASMQQLTRASVTSSADVTMAAKPKTLSPGSNYPTTKNIQTQKNGFGTFLQKFQTTKGKSKYGVPIFLPNGNINPAYLAAERAEEKKQKAKNIQATEAKRKGLIASKQFEL